MLSLLAWFDDLLCCNYKASSFANIMATFCIVPIIAAIQRKKQVCVWYQEQPISTNQCFSLHMISWKHVSDSISLDVPKWYVNMYYFAMGSDVLPVWTLLCHIYL